MINITRCSNRIGIICLAHDICFTATMGGFLWVADCNLGWNNCYGFIRSRMISARIITLLLLNKQIIKFHIFTCMGVLLFEIKWEIYSDLVVIIWIHFWALFPYVLGEKLVMYLSPRIHFAEDHRLESIDVFFIDFI